MPPRHQQEPPFAIQVELAEGCNLQCTFCGIQGIREKAGGPYKFMTAKVAERLASQIAVAGWTSRIEFAMHGEPTMNPDFVKLIGIFRKHLPKNQIMMTSNAAGFLKDTEKTVAALFAAGLNVLALDDYKRVKIVPKVRERCAGKFPIHDYPADGRDLSPHRRWAPGTQVIIIIQDLEDQAGGSHSNITNHCGAGSPPNNNGAGKRCAKPFRAFTRLVTSWLKLCRRCGTMMLSTPCE